MAKNDCPHNSGVICPERGRQCQTCGWSPEVDARRRNPNPNPVEQPSQQAPKHIGGRPRQVVKVDESGTILGFYPSLVAAAEANHMSPVTLKTHCQGKLKNPFKCTGGYTFRYADQEVVPQ